MPVFLICVELVLNYLLELYYFFVSGHTHLFSLQVEVSVISIEKTISQEQLRHSRDALDVQVAIPYSLIRMGMKRVHFRRATITGLRVELFLDGVHFAVHMNVESWHGWKVAYSTPQHREHLGVVLNIEKALVPSLALAFVELLQNLRLVLNRNWYACVPSVKQGCLYLQQRTTSDAYALAVDIIEEFAR